MGDITMKALLCVLGGVCVFLVATDLAVQFGWERVGDVFGRVPYRGWQSMSAMPEARAQALGVPKEPHKPLSRTIEGFTLGMSKDEAFAVFTNGITTKTFTTDSSFKKNEWANGVA